MKYLTGILLFCLLTALSTGQIMAQKVNLSGPFINTWLVIGTFDNDSSNSGFNSDYIGETQVKPNAQLVTAGKSWRYFDDRLFSRNYDDYQDLFSYFGIKRDESIAAKVAYAHVYIYTPNAQTGELRIGANNEFKAWINGELVLSSEKTTPYRDSLKTAVSLVPGWNRLLVKIANQENGRFGFYARICDANGDALPNVTYSAGGPTGHLSICSKSMADIKTGNMPAAFREWPYVEADPLKAIARNDMQFLLRNTNLMLHASPFNFTAQGGTPPYKWTLISGSLPPGLKLAKNGAISGKVSLDAALKNYPFKVEVTDAKGNRISSSFTIKLHERPNRWYETDKLVALIHGPESLADDQILRLAALMKAEGYGIGMPISYNNGDMKYRWPSTYAAPGTVDTIAKFKSALEGAGLKFGMYMGYLGNANDGGDNGSILMVEEALRKYHPKAFWFDWCSPDVYGYQSPDALFSMIKTIDPEIVIAKNTVHLPYHGDWDVISLEGYYAWGKYYWSIWPSEMAWPKKSVVESWRLIIDPKWADAKGASPDWKVYMRIILTIIGEGQVANLDHTATLVSGLEKDGILHKLEDSPISMAHFNMAAWANPAGKPSLTESYTKVDMGPLDGGVYGYNTINLSRTAIYIHMLKNPFGRTGMPVNAPLLLTGVKQKVKSITWMNGNTPVKFKQTGEKLTVNLTGISPDEVDTILKINLQGAHPNVAKKLFIAPPTSPGPPVPAGNLAYFKPSKLMSNDGITELEPSGGLSEAKCGVDGDLETTAQGAWEYAWTYHVDLMKLYNIRTVRILFSKTCWATDYKVLLSADGKTWNEITHVTNGTGGTVEHPANGMSARYIRVTALKPDGPGQEGAQMGIDELQVYE